MGLFYTAPRKERSAARKRIALDVAIPALMEQGFQRSPFSGSWYGYNAGHHSYSYELVRLKEGGLLELLMIHVHGSDRRITVDLNVFRLHPVPTALEALAGQTGMHFHMPPNNRSWMRLPDHPGPPILWMFFVREHRLGSYWTRSGYEREVERLSRLMERDMKRIDHFFAHWHTRYQPNKVDWTGHPIPHVSSA